MGPAYYIMAILGCAEGDTACRQVAVAEARYESVETCQAATEAALMRHTDAAFPVVVAQCQIAGQPAARISGAEIDLPDPASAKPRIQRAAVEKGSGRL